MVYKHQLKKCDYAAIKACSYTLMPRTVWLLVQLLVTSNGFGTDEHNVLDIFALAKNDW